MANVPISNGGIRKLLLLIISGLGAIVLVFFGTWITRVEDAVRISIAVETDVSWIKTSLTKIDNKMDLLLRRNSLSYSSPDENLSLEVYD